MVKIVKGARVIQKRSDISGQLPTIPSNDDHTTGWLDTDIYKGELFINMADVRAFTRNDASIIEFVMLDPATQKINVNQLPTSILGSVIYQGVWDASSGLPPTTTPQKGWYYVVNVSGNTSLGTISDWQVQDWAIYNGNGWDKIDNTEEVVDFSPFLRLSGGTMTGTLTGTDIGLSGNIYISGMTSGATGSVVYYDIVSGKLSYADSSLLTPTYISNLAPTIATVDPFGGIPAGTTVASLTGKTFSYLFDMMVFPTKNPTITTQRSATLTGTLTTPVEVGFALSPTLLATYNMGVITNGDGTTTTSLTGSASQYTFKLPDGTVDFVYATTNNTRSRSYSTYAAVKGSNTWTVTIDYSAGTTPYYDSKGVASSLLNASRVAGSITATSSAVVAYYYQWNGSGLAHPTTSADIRALTNKSFLTGSNNTGTFTITVLANMPEVYFYVPAGRTVQVLFVESSNANVTGTFVKTDIQVTDATLTTNVNYEMYVSNIGTGYLENKHYTVTLT